MFLRSLLSSTNSFSNESFKAARAVKAKQAARAQEKVAPADQVTARDPVKALERAQARLAVRYDSSVSTNCS